MTIGRYAWETLARIVFEGQTYTEFDTCLTCYGETGDQVRLALEKALGQSWVRHCDASLHDYLAIIPPQPKRSSYQ